MKRRWGIAAGAAVLVAMATVSAQAAVPMSVNIDRGAGLGACPQGRFCLYQNYSFNTNDLGLVLKTDESIPNLGYYGFNDQASSVFNNTDSIVQVYWDYDYGGEWLTYFPDDYGDVPARWNDQISSVRVR